MKLTPKTKTASKMKKTQGEDDTKNEDDQKTTTSKIGTTLKAMLYFFPTSEEMFIFCKSQYLV